MRHPEVAAEVLDGQQGLVDALTGEVLGGAGLLQRLTEQARRVVSRDDAVVEAVLRVRGAVRLGELRRTGAGVADRQGGRGDVVVLRQGRPRLGLQQLGRERRVVADDRDLEAGGGGDTDQRGRLTRARTDDDGLDAGLLECGDLGGHVVVGGLDLLLDDGESRLLRRVLRAGQGVLAVVALEVDMADLVALGDALLGEQVVDRVDRLDVVRGSDDPDVLAAEQIRRPGLRQDESLVLAVDALLDRRHERRTDELDEAQHLRLQLGVSGDGLLRVVAVVAHGQFDLALADAARGVGLLDPELLGLGDTLAERGVDPGHVGERTQRDRRVRDALTGLHTALVLGSLVGGLGLLAAAHEGEGEGRAHGPEHTQFHFFSPEFFVRRVRPPGRNRTAATTAAPYR